MPIEKTAVFRVLILVHLLFSENNNDGRIGRHFSCLLYTSFRYESGIWLSMGASKWRAILMLLVSTIIIAIPAVVVSVLSSSGLASLILRYQASAAGNRASSVRQFVTGVEMDTSIVVATLNASMNIFFYAVVAGSILLACILPSYAVLKLKPRDVYKRQLFSKACKAALKNYLRAELKEGIFDKTYKRSKLSVPLRKIGKAVAVAVITLTLLFSTCMVANAQFREKVIAWVIETFEKYSIFELKSDGENAQLDLMAYKATYIPDGALLLNTCLLYTSRCV